MKKGTRTVLSRHNFRRTYHGALAKLTAMHIGNRQFYRELGWGEASW